MIKCRAPSPEERADFLGWMREHMEGTVEAVMGFLDLSWEGFAELFDTVGEVRAIHQDRSLAGFLWIEKRERELHIHGVILRSECRGKGLGTSILEGLEAEFAGQVDVIELGVRTTNADAIRFYEKNGFRLAKSIDEIGFNVLQKPLA